jgi:hypothetical protein
MKPTPEHRALHLATVDDYAAELDRLEAAHGSGGLTVSGSYSSAQNLHHLARWIENYETGTLPDKVPFFMRLIGPIMKGRILTKGFPKGLQGPDGKPQTEPDHGFDESLAYLRSKLDVLRTRDLAHKNPFFGRMTRENCVELHLRHAEHHLGFIHPGGSDG